jgi:hypothetical protein
MWHPFFKYISLVMVFIYAMEVGAQEELIGPVPRDRGLLRGWKAPDLLPEKHARNLRFHAITYGREGKVPLPSMAFGYRIHDWNRDGIDDIIGCHYPFHAGVPYIRVYLSSGGTEPLFSSPDESQVILTDERLGRYFDFMDVNHDGQDELITFEAGTRTLLAFENKGTISDPDWESTCLTDEEGLPWKHIQDVLKTPPFNIVDWDNDGREDLLVGANHPSLMRHSFGTDPATMHPEAFRVYFVKNIDGKSFARPQLITAGGEPVKFLGFAYPLAHDMDGDGLPDLVCGEHRPGIRVMKNVSKELPMVKSIGYLKDEKGKRIDDITYFHLEMGDVTGDGNKEFIGTTQFSGVTYYYPLYMTGDPMRWRKGAYLMMEGRPETPVYGPSICTVETMDWDSDGDTDLLLGAEPGMPMILENTGDENKKVWANPRRIKFYDGTPVRTYSIILGDGSHHGAWEWYDDRSAPTVADWDGDGTPDIISSTQGRRLYWMKGKMTDNELRFSQPKTFRIMGMELLHPHRCKPGIIDWNGDGKLDIVALNPVSNLVIYLGNQDATLSYTDMVYPLTTRNEPLNGDPRYIEPLIHTTISGRTGIALFDWDHDGHMDIITHKHRGPVLYYRNSGEAEAVFEPARVMFDFDSHLAGPAVMDWNNDGYPDIILGGDRKRLAGELKMFPHPVKAQLMWYDGRSLPFPSKKR